LPIAFPNTLDPLEYRTLDVIVCTTNVCAVNVPLVKKLSADDAVAANDADVAVPENDPVNPAVDVKLPLNIAGPIFVNVPLPDTVNEPVINIVEPLIVKLGEPVIEFVVSKYATWLATPAPPIPLKAPTWYE
jgi:hypothetical protein